MVKNTSYKVHAGTTTDAERLTYNIEEGAYVTTESGVWTVYNNAWVKVYPQAGEGTGIGWCRYDDGLYNSENKLTLSSGVETTLTNNGASWKVTADGSTCNIWDIIYFIQKTQSYA